MNVRRYVLVWLVSLCGLAGSFAFGAASASATITHQFLSQITEVPAGPGVSSSGPFVRPQAIAADSGSLYVADGGEGEGQGRLDKFDASSGALTLQFAPAPSLSYLRQGVAVAHGTGEVYLGGDESVAGVPEGAVAVFDAAGALQQVWKGADTPTAGFGCFECQGAGDVAMDNNPSSLDDWAAGDVYVSVPQQGFVDVFKPKAGGGEEYVTRLEREPGVPFSEAFGVAVDSLNGDVLVLDASGVDVFEPTVLDQYALVRRLTETEAGHPFGPLNGLTVDGGNGDVYVAEQTGPHTRVIDQFSSTGVYLGRLTGTPSGPFALTVASLTVDPATHDVYVGDAQAEAEVVDVFGPSVTIPDVVTEPASDVKPRGATLNGTVAPDAIQLTGCSFDYGTTAAYDQSAPCVPAAGAIPADSNRHAVSAPLAGLAPDTTYHFRLQAGNANGANMESEDREFTTLGPGIHQTSVLNVTSDSATLAASIDPNDAATTYYFQYGTSTEYGADVPAAGAAVGAGKGDVEVSQPVRLTPGTLYHYRVVVRSEPAPGEPFEEAGPDRTFTTQGAQAPGLPDGRAWEMVSPPDKHGASLEALSPLGGGLIQAANNGDAIAYLARGPVDAEPSANRSLLFTQVLATRGPGGWTSRGIATPNERPNWSPKIAGDEYDLFSSDLSIGLVEPEASKTLLSPAASEQTPYIREANGEYTPLVTAANVPAGTEFGQINNLSSSTRRVSFAGASADLSHVVVGSTVALTEDTVSGPQGLYEWAGGALRLVSVLPNNKPAAEENDGAALGNEEGFDVRNAVSDDGSRIVWTGREENGSEAHLYMRDMRLGATVQLDVAEAGAHGGRGTTIFQTASSDDSKVFFTDSSGLTKDANPSDLYMCEIGEAAGKPTCTLKDLTADGNAGEAAVVSGNVLGASEDGRYVYFAAQGALAPGAAPHGNCEGQGGMTLCNLYVYDTVTGVRRLVAALSSEDDSDWTTGDGGASILNTVKVSPSGRYLAFMSLRSLTGYDNIDAHSGQPDTEVFLYDASSGNVTCASCNPTGARPVGVFDTSFVFPGLLVDRYIASGWGHHWLAGSIPGAERQSGEGNSSWYQPRDLSDSGRLFFNSADGLVSQDTNGLEDVYEYEPGGVGSCTAGTSCVSLISSGASGEESAFLDASESGDDVFFLTASQLVPQDTDSELDVYDAHVCAASSPCVTPAPAPAPAAPCDTSDSCHGSGASEPEVFGAPSSTSVAGAGNLAAPPPVKPVVKAKALSRAQKLASALRSCKKKPKGKRRASCEAQARRSYGKGVKAKRKDAGAKKKGKR